MISKNDIIKLIIVFLFSCVWIHLVLLKYFDNLYNYFYDSNGIIFSIIITISLVQYMLITPLYFIYLVNKSFKYSLGHLNETEKGK